MKLIATRAFSYATRRLKPGDDFEAPAMVARALIGAKKARGGEEAPRPPPPPPPVDHEREQLRAEAAALGIDVDGRWGVERLREEIEAVVVAEPEPTPDEPPE